MSDTWLFTEDRVWPEQVPWKESLFSVANGHLGTRGTFEEGYGDSVPATFMHGLFVTPPGDLPYLAPLPDWTGVSITVDGVRFRLDDRIPLGYERVLDLRTGILTRRVLWRGPGTGVIRAEFRRLLSMASPGLAAMEVKVTAVTEDVQVGVETGLDGSITGPYGAPWTRVEWTRTGPDRLRMRAQSDDRQASVTATSVIRGLGPLGVTHHARHPRLSATIDLAPGEWLGFTKYTSYQRATRARTSPTTTSIRLPLLPPPNGPGAGRPVRSKSPATPTPSRPSVSLPFISSAGRHGPQRGREWGPASSPGTAIATTCSGTPTSSRCPISP